MVLSDLVESSGYSSKTLQKRIMSICASGRGFTVWLRQNARPPDFVGSGEKGSKGNWLNVYGCSAQKLLLYSKALARISELGVP